MGKLWLLGIFLLLLVSCKQNQTDSRIAEDAEMEINGEELPKRVRLNSKSTNVLKDWEEFNAFETSFDALYNVANNEDLILVIDDLIDKQKVWEDSKYPDAFDKAQIKSRQKVLKTYLLKVKSALEFRVNATEPTKEMIDAYNALRGQFDVIMNATLDPELLIDEE